MRRAAGEFEWRRVSVNGQPGRVLLGPGEQRFGDDERRAVEHATALLQAGDVDADGLVALMTGGRELPGGGRSGAFAAPGAELHVWAVITADVADGRIQAVRMVRNPDKLAHLEDEAG